MMMMTSLASHCGDLSKNGDETGVDCGGSCSAVQKCADGTVCTDCADCTSDVCVSGFCLRKYR